MVSQERQRVLREVPCSPSMAPDPARLTAQIMARGTSLMDLEVLMSESVGSLNYIHVAAAWSRMAKIQQSQQRPSPRHVPSLDRETVTESGSVWRQITSSGRQLILSQTVAESRNFGARQAASVLWAAAVLGSFHEVDSELHRLCANALMSASSRTLIQCSTQELACSIYALARLSWTDPGESWREAFFTSCTRQWSSFRSQELSMMLWAVATLGWNTETSRSSTSGAMVAPSSDWFRDLLLAQVSS
jgi:hypothetical protein